MEGGYKMTRKEEIKKAKVVFYTSSDDYTVYNKGFEEGAKWADKTLIEKACEWLKENLPNRMYDRNCCLDNFTEYLIEDLRKAMEK